MLLIIIGGLEKPYNFKITVPKLSLPWVRRYAYGLIFIFFVLFAFADIDQATVTAVDRIDNLVMYKSFLIIFDYSYL